MFYLETDTSNLRMAAVLMQIKEGNKVLISAASRAITSAEKNNGIAEREALAVVWEFNTSQHTCLVKRFSRYRSPVSEILSNF